MTLQNDKVDLTVMVSCYNERDSVCDALDIVQEAMRLFGGSFEVLIYDDCSKDDSVEVVKRYIEKHRLEDRFTIIENKTNMGIGVNYFRAAKRGKGEFILTINGDASITARDLYKLLDLKDKADVIIPNYSTRLFNKKFNLDHRTFKRRLLSRIFTLLVRLLSGIRIWYFNGLVLHKRENVVKNSVETFGLGYTAELLCRVLQDPSVMYLEVRMPNYDRKASATTAFRAKNVISVLGSLWRIFRSRFA